MLLYNGEPNSQPRNRPTGEPPHRTHNNRNEMAKQTRARIATGKTPQFNKLSLIFNVEVNPVEIINDLTQRLNAASPLTDVVLTSPVITAEDPETTRSGVNGIVESKKDPQSEQVEVAASTDQPMTSVDSEQMAPQLITVASAITGSSTQSAPASSLHVERSQLVDGSPTKSSDFGQLEWEIPNPNVSDINPREDLPSIRARLLREGNDAEKLSSLRLHREQLEALDPVLFNWDTRIKAHVPHLQKALGNEEATEITLLQRIKNLSAAQSKLPMGIPDTDARWVSHQASADAAQNDFRLSEGRQAFLKARILETNSLLWHTAEQLTAANKEWVLLGDDIKQIARRVATARTASTQPRDDSPPSSMKRAQTEEKIVELPTQGAHWPALALPRGESRGRKIRDPAFNAPKYQQALGLHQVMTADQTRLARNRLYLNTATKALRNRFLSNDPIVHEQEVNLIFTNMDAADYQDQEIESALGTLGLHFAGPPKWLTSNTTQAQDTRTITARVPAMTKLLWEYIDQVAICLQMAFL
jgi:hypothetical protein